MGRTTKKVLVVGGGVAALEASIGLHWDETLDLDVTLVSETDDFVYRALAVLEPFGHGRAPKFSIREILDGAVDRILHGTIARFDLERSEAVTESGDVLKFDAAIVATGGEPRSQLENAIVIGTPGAMEQLSIVVAQIDAGLVPRIAFCVPEGASWRLPMYELAMFTAARARQRMRPIEVELMTPEARPLIQFGKQASDTVVKFLGEAEVRLTRSCAAETFRDGKLTTSRGTTVETEFVVAMPELHGTPIAGLPHGGNGFLPVDRYGLVDGTNNIYAAGDITDFPIKQGGIASQQADAAVGGLIELLGGRSAPRPFTPELRGLLLSPYGHAVMNAIVGEHDESLDSVTTDPLISLTEKIHSRHLTQRLKTLAALHATVG